MSASPVPYPEPKIFGWAYEKKTKLLKEINKESRSPLMEAEADLIVAILFDHVIGNLEQMGFGRQIYEARLEAQDLRDYQERKEAKRPLSEKQRKKEEADLLHRLTNRIVAALRQWRSFFSITPFHELTLNAAFAREIYAANALLTGVVQQWRILTPAQKFLLVGGEEALDSFPIGTFPPKFFQLAIREIGIRGTVSERSADIVIDSEQIARARRLCATIPPGPFIERFGTKKNNVPVLVQGLTPKLSMRGRAKSNRDAKAMVNSSSSRPTASKPKP
ncbi:MAG: hypothetical protein ABSF76_03530 [Opitutaceae bacterium]|jgi:hypothetical protein